ncbi:N-acetylmuramoyl-L-alanine amidase [Ornithinibacillus halotolerans]|nr:N-acetylmuramoyl-L-alanine amidase [Ornithinibacillus halotolerans]
MLILSLLLMPTMNAVEEKGNDHVIQSHEFLLPILNSEPRTENITHIVIHSISNIVAKPESPYNITDIYLLLLEYGLSTHYVIDREGTIFQFVSDDRVAYHAGRSSLPQAPFIDHSMNDFSIGIEIMGIGTKEEMTTFIPEKIFDSINPQHIGFTEKQYKSLQILIADLINRYPSIRHDRFHIIGHEDYAAGRKVDPGKLFNWKKINLE